MKHFPKIKWETKTGVEKKKMVLAPSIYDDVDQKFETKYSRVDFVSFDMPSLKSNKDSDPEFINMSQIGQTIPEWTK